MSEVERVEADVKPKRPSPGFVATAIWLGLVIGLIEVRDADRDLLAASDQLVQARAGAAKEPAEKSPWPACKATK